MTGLFKKIKDAASKGIEKGAELGVKGLDGAAVAAKKGYDNARSDQKQDKHASKDALEILKTRFAKGEITKEEFEEKKKMLE